MGRRGGNRHAVRRSTRVRAVTFQHTVNMATFVPHRAPMADGLQTSAVRVYAPALDALSRYRPILSDDTASVRLAPAAANGRTNGAMARRGSAARLAGSDGSAGSHVGRLARLAAAGATFGTDPDRPHAKPFLRPILTDQNPIDASMLPHSTALCSNMGVAKRMRKESVR